MTGLERNRFISQRYDELMLEGKHGHYETMYRVFAELLEKLEVDSHAGVGRGGLG